MNRVVPWAELVAPIEPVYPKPEGAGRPPVSVERMLRLHCLQQWFNLSDPAAEEALYDSGVALTRSDLVACIVRADSILDVPVSQNGLVSLPMAQSDYRIVRPVLLRTSSVIRLSSCISSLRHTLRWSNIFVIFSHGLHDHVLR